MTKVPSKPVSSQEDTCKKNSLEVKEHAYKEDGEVWASSHISKKPGSSQEDTCKKNSLEVKEHTYKEDGEVWASSHISKKHVTSQEDACKENSLEVKEHAHKEDGEVWASSHISKKPVSSQENTCKEDSLEVKEHAYKEDGENSQRRGKASDITKSQNVMKGMATNTQFNYHVTSDVNRHLSGKTFVTPMCQNSLTTVTCSSKKRPSIKMSTVFCSTQKATVPSAKEDLL
eukprot:8019343-Ditylum_brightwellii.AAC.1